MTINKQGRSRLSYASVQPELANDNPLLSKAPRLTHSFETKRCDLNAKQLADITAAQSNHRRDLDAFKAKRRGQSHGSGMVKSHKPYPELKPSPALSHSVKAQSYYQELAKERQTAHRNNKTNPTTISKGSTMENTQNTSHPQNQNPPSNKPELVVRDGSLKATIWRNEGDKGPYYTTALAKTYTDQQGNPRDTQNFSQTDLLRVAELGREAYGMISELKRQHSLENSQNHTQDRKNFKQSRRNSNGQIDLPVQSQQQKSC